MREPLDAAARARRNLLLYSTAFAAAALAVALLGAAGIAWLARRAGLPFLKTWLIVSAIIVLPGLTAAVWQLVRKR